MIRYTHGGSGETVQWIAIAAVFEQAGNSADGTVQNETAQSFFRGDSRCTLRGKAARNVTA
jgi:hypothetical protein